MRFRHLRFIGVVASVVLTAAGCGGSNTPGTTTSKLNIAYLPRQINNPVFDVARQGAQNAATELGGQLTQVGPSESTAASQVPYIQTLTQQHVDAILISANDQDAVAPALKQAMQKGIKVVGFDSPPASDARNVMIAEATDQGLGDVEVDMMCNDLPGCSGPIGIVSGTATSPNQNKWIDVMKQDMATNPKYQGLKLVQVVYGNDNPETAVQVVQGMLTAHPEIKGIIAPTSVGIVAAAQILEQTGKAGKIALTGLGLPNSLKKYIKDGTMKEFALWDFVGLGYLTYYTAALLVQGKIKGKPGETYTAGKLGQFTIDQNGVVVLGPPLRFNASNIDNYNF